EAVQSAQEIASSYNNQIIEPEHLLAALLQDSDGAIVPILQKVGANVQYLRIKITELLEALPKVQGAGIANQHISRPLGQILENAQKQASQLKDEYVSTEHLLLAILDQNSKASKLLKDQGINREGIYAALKEVRGNQRVTDQNPEDKYQSLEKFGRDLNELAR